MTGQQKILTASSFLAMFFLGVGAQIIGAAARNIGLAPHEIGLLISIQNSGFMVSVIVSGTLADSFNKPRILFVGSMILAVSFFGFYRIPLFLINLFIIFFIGAGIGSYEGVTDAMLLDIHKEKENLFINVNHFFVTFGALMITLYLLFLQMDWQKSLSQSAVAVFMLAICFGVTRLPQKRKRGEGWTYRFRFLVQQKVVFILFFVTICAIGLELCLMGIMTTFLMELRGFSQVTSKLGLIVFLAGIGAGRLLIGFVAKREHLFLIITLLFAFSALLSTALFYIPAGGLVYVLILGTGITISSILPLTITLAGIIYRNMSGTVLGIIKLAIPFGGIVISFLLSIISRYTSLQLSLALFPLIAFMGFAILVSSRKSFKSRLA
jgi:MFS family permease